MLLTDRGTHDHGAGLTAVPARLAVAAGRAVIIGFPMWGAVMKRDPYKLEPSASPTTPNTGYRWSGLFIAGLAGAILVVLGVIWAWQGAPGGSHVAAQAPPPATAPTTAGSGH
ncbi:MAG TPA: hypothetical protein VFT69_06130 [Pseudolabrys sp.]|jgi:hypothetical protein|nr:hypothetical protein [Pseudolabrys sp.]